MCTSKRSLDSTPWSGGAYGRTKILPTRSGARRFARVQFRRYTPWLPKTTRQGQTSREAGTQSHGPHAGSRATERRRFVLRTCRRLERAATTAPTTMRFPTYRCNESGGVRVLEQHARHAGATVVAASKPARPHALVLFAPGCTIRSAIGSGESWRERADRRGSPARLRSARVGRGDRAGEPALAPLEEKDPPHRGDGVSRSKVTKKLRESWTKWGTSWNRAPGLEVHHESHQVAGGMSQST